MNVLYKYCDQVGIKKILETLELKLPYISQVNDPLECLPFIYCPDDLDAIKARCSSVSKRRKKSPSTEYKQKRENGEIHNGEIHKIFEEKMRELHEDFNQKGCLLSVSKTAQNTVMWAHYAEKHKGAVIGIDFNNISPDTNGPPGILMDSVIYSKDRPKRNVLSELVPEEFRKTLSTKSIDWRYEEEFRAIFFVNSLEIMQQQELAYLKDFKGKKTWFLRLNPVSIREVIFGLYTDESLKLAISKLIERQDLQHVKLRQAEESETYTLNLK